MAMATKLDTIKKEIASLGISAKTEILRTLLADLDIGNDSDVEEAWMRESKRRYQELASGKVKPVPATLVFQKARDRLQG